jgi:hypothetical protein
MCRYPWGISIVQLQSLVLKCNRVGAGKEEEVGAFLGVRVVKDGKKGTGPSI